MFALVSNNVVELDGLLLQVASGAGIAFPAAVRGLNLVGFRHAARSMGAGNVCHNVCKLWHCLRTRTVKMPCRLDPHAALTRIACVDKGAQVDHGLQCSTDVSAWALFTSL